MTGSPAAELQMFIRREARFPCRTWSTRVTTYAVRGHTQPC